MQRGIKKVKLKIISDGKFSMQHISQRENTIENKFSVTLNKRLNLHLEFRPVLHL